MLITICHSFQYVLTCCRILLAFSHERSLGGNCGTSATPFVPTPSGSCRPWSTLRPPQGRGRNHSDDLIISREFGDVVFEDAGFETNSLLALKNWRRGDFTPKADVGEGLKTICFKPHILKHQIPEHPNSDDLIIREIRIIIRKTTDWLQWDLGCRLLVCSA